MKAVQVETDTTLTLEVGYPGAPKSLVLTMARREHRGASWVMSAGVSLVQGGKVCRW